MRGGTPATAWRRATIDTHSRSWTRLPRWAIEDLALGRLELVTDPANVGSQRVAEKAGFRREGVLRSHLLHRDGRRRDSVLFSLLPDELG